MKKIFILFLIYFIKSSCNAQSITGTWEGDLGGDEFLQINIIQVGNNVCGYTWDHAYRTKRDYCKAYFNGSIDKTSGTIFINGYAFMENSGGHVLMQIKVKVGYQRGVAGMTGYCRTSASLFFGAGSPIDVALKKVSPTPQQITPTMQDCIKEYKAQKQVIKPKPLVTKPNNKPAPIIKKKDSTKIIIPTIIKPDTLKKTNPTPILKLPQKQEPLPITLKGRINKEISRIVIHEKKIKLEVYDNGTVDGDTVSIFYNGRAIVSRKGLSTIPIVINLTLDENTNIHSIVMYAENLGSIPPNTALIILTTATGKRYELYSSSTLEQNAALIFEYKPL